MNEAPEHVIADLADAKADITLSLHRVLTGFMERMGGPEKFGHALADIMKDENVTVASRVSLANNMAKLMGEYGENENDHALIDDEQIIERLRSLEA
jgi:putative alpha-1,2-mannosidase